MNYPQSSLWQSPAWKQFQEALGRKVFVLEYDSISALIIQHPLAFGKCWFEIPRGPVWNEASSAQEFDHFWTELRKLAQDANAIFSRINPFVPLPYKVPNSTVAFFDHHPQTTLQINLSLSEEDILKQMKPKGRYNIKVASKHGVDIVQSHDALPFYQLLQETTERDGFRGHGAEFYQTMIKALKETGLLLYAKYQDRIIAGGIFTLSDQCAIYYYGASGNNFRNVMAPYLLQWEAMKIAKERGCTLYDLLGIAPTNAPKSHPWRGVTDFKLKFGGEVVNSPPAQDIVYQTLPYSVRKLWKKIR